MTPEKCICGHTQSNHLSSQYGNMPRTYGECKFCSECILYLTLKDVANIKQQLDYYYKKCGELERALKGAIITGEKQ